MAASIPGDGVPGKLERARSSLHTLAGSALLIGSTVMRPDNTAEELPKDRAFEAMFSDELGRAMFDQHNIVELLPEDPEKEQKCCVPGHLYGLARIGIGCGVSAAAGLRDRV